MLIDIKEGDSVCVLSRSGTKFTGIVATVDFYDMTIRVKHDRWYSIEKVLTINGDDLVLPSNGDKVLFQLGDLRPGWPMWEIKDYMKQARDEGFDAQNGEKVEIADVLIRSLKSKIKYKNKTYFIPKMYLFPIRSEWDFKTSNNFASLVKRR